MFRKASLIFALFLTLSAGFAGADEPGPIRLLIWDERQPEQKQAYGMFLGDYLAAQFEKLPGITVTSVGIDDPEQGLSDDILDNHDVLIWWAHVRHGEISRETSQRIVSRVRDGRLSLIPLHSALSSRPFIDAMRTCAVIDAAGLATEMSGDFPSRVELTLKDPGPEVVRPEVDPRAVGIQMVLNVDGTAMADVPLPACSIGSWREDSKPSHIQVLAPHHPIAAGLPATFTIPHTEMYNEPFQVPAPDVVVLYERWDAGEEFRSGCLWNLGKGKVFYFRPGHETDDVFTHPEPMRVLENAVRFLALQQSLNH